MIAREQLVADGFALVREVYSQDECRRLAEKLFVSLAACDDQSAALRSSSGALYGARNLLELFPPAVELWRRPALTGLLLDVLGPSCGLVRGLFFDKPPHGSWSLPWHRDLTIAVKQHGPIGGAFCNPTTKAGVPHVEAPDEVLHQMLTLRIHLDAATQENGPLQVVPGSHVGRDANPSCEPVPILVGAGDVLAMRPLLLHASGESHAGTAMHRRVVHLEFAASSALPEGYQWRQFHAN